MTTFRSLMLTAAVLILIGGAGCKSENEAVVPTEVHPPETVQPSAVPQTTPGEVNRVAVSGKVLETLDASSYTYVNVETASGSEQWVAIPQTDLEAGQEVSFAPGMEMQNLESKSLGRTFESVVFSSGIQSGEQGGAAAAPAEGGESFSEALQSESSSPMMGGGDQMFSGGSGAAVVPSAEVNVEKAEGENAYSVSEIYAQRSELNNQQVKIRGKVMKVSRMIMGKNWIHLQDGTGNPADNTHDLVVTSMAEPEKGAVVVAEGTLQADKDFGSGYRYDVIIEEAEIK